MCVGGLGSLSWGGGEELGVKVDFHHIVKQLGCKCLNQVLLLSFLPPSWFVGQHHMHVNIYISVFFSPACADVFRFQKAMYG